MSQSFINQCIHGSALIGDIDDFVERWHTGDTGVSLPAFLGMTGSEYSSWVSDPGVLQYIIDSKRGGSDG